MPTTPHIETLGPFDLVSATTVLARIPVANYTHMSIHGRNGGGATAWGAGTPAVVGVKWANSADAEPSDFSTAVNITNAGVSVGSDSSSDLDVSRVAFICLVVDTAEAGTKGLFDVCLTDNRGA